MTLSQVAATNSQIARRIGRVVVGKELLTGIGWWWLFAVGLLIPRLALLRSPPYVEQAFALWTEAAFLVDSNFDYQRLREQERTTDEGGWRAYMYNAPATGIALLLCWLSPSDAFLAYRLFTLASATTILWAIFRILQRRTGVATAMLTCLALATVPLFSVQVEMLGVDLPMVAVASLCLLAVERRRYVLAALLTLPAFAMKNSAFMISAALCGYLTLSLLLGRTRATSTRVALRFGVCVSALLCLLEMGLLFAGDNARTRMHFPRSSDLYLWRASAPDVMLTMLLAGVVTLVFYKLLVGQIRQSDSGIRVWHALGRAWTLVDESYGPLWFAWILSFLSMALILPVFFESRYLCLPVVCLYLAIGLLCSHRTIDMPTAGSRLDWYRRAVCYCALSVLVCVNVANQFGYFFPRLPLQMARGWGTLERSLEYRVDHESNIRATRVLDCAGQRTPVLVTDWFVHFVTVPQLGYVERSLAPADWERHFDAYDDNLRAWLLDDAPAATLVHVYPQRSLAFPALCIAEPGSDDELLYDDELRPPVTIFRRTWSGSSNTPQGLRERLDAITADAVQLDPAARLLALGWADLACRWLAAETSRSAADDALRPELIKRLQTARQQASVVFEGAALERLGQRFAACERFLRDEKGNLSDLPPPSLAERGLSVELPQRVLYLHGHHVESQSHSH
ncbi:MAG: glycosyltransferase family 39 protein [Pirellulales bacterium]|nr:glycosyltransferase family 39 protein [Pirellulales bacterium]